MSRSITSAIASTTPNYIVSRYVTIRLNYFKRTLYMSKTIREMANDAFSRWKRVAEEVGY